MPLDTLLTVSEEGSFMVNVKVKYKYGTGTNKPNVVTHETVQAGGRTESAVMAALTKKHPNRTIIILEIL